ncbi:formamidopyrimidine-DNA glycosylase [Kwoniella sp. DSM 27419]
MPELPEVERARKLIHETCRGYKIESVDSTEDKIVYTGGTNHEDFAKEITGRTILNAERKGKTFWMNLSGDGRMPVMHFGMTGMVQIKGQEPTWYRRRPRENPKTWPPRFYKFVLKLEPQDGSVGDQPVELAFLDGRRLGRLRLVPDPVREHPPVSALGFDPVLGHPTLEEFQDLIAKKKGTTKGMIMDQAFSAGVGNWVADEVLYQARIHPACPVNHLSAQNVKDLHHQLQAVTNTAVAVNADHKLFPEDWLFRWRWAKGHKHKKGSDKASKTKKKVDSDVEASEEEGEEDIKPKGRTFLALPDGSPATIEFIEVGGRTTAVVTELQKMPEGVEIKPKISKGGKGSQSKKRPKDDDSDTGSGSSDSVKKEVTTPVKATTSRQRAAASKKMKIEPKEEIKEEQQHEPLKKTPTSGRQTRTGATKGKRGAKSGSSGTDRSSRAGTGTRGGGKVRSGGRGGKGRRRAGSQGSQGSSELSDLPSD